MSNGESAADKIVLSNVYLVNWYGFINTQIPIGANLTLITGENECGKSTILDAIKYAFTGDVGFNKSSSSGSNRTLASYTRCLTDASSGVFARPVEKIPNVYSHISLEYYDKINSNSFILGVILETNPSNNIEKYWYAIDQTNMEEIKYTYEDHGVLKPYDSQKFQKQYGVQLLQQKDGLMKFMQMTGLKFASPEIRKFQRKLKNLMTYNPAAKIQEFIKESVLEEHEVNFDKLRDAKNNIEKINNTLDLIEEEVTMLGTIIKHFEEHDSVSSRLIVDNIKIIYKDWLKVKDNIDQATISIDENKVELKHLDTVIQEMSTQKGDVEDAYLKAREDLSQLDCSKAIESEQQKLKNYEQLKGRLIEEKEALTIFQNYINEMINLLTSMNVQMDNEFLLQTLEANEPSKVEKENAINKLKTIISTQQECLIEQRSPIANQLKAVQTEIIQSNQVIEASNKNKLDHSYLKDQIALIKEINREFQKHRINSEAKFAFEYVVKVVDEEWRRAIEAFLGMRRFSIIVEPEHFKVANRILDESFYKYVELVNTPLLVKKTLKSVDDSVSNKLEIKNEIAEKYFSYWLGNIHAVEINDVAKYERAMSKEGKLSRNMAVTFINTKKIKTFCLGQEAIEINKQRAQVQVVKLEEEETEILVKQRENENNIQLIKKYMDHFKVYNYSAHSDYGRNMRSINEIKASLKQLLEAQKDNSEFLTLNERVQELDMKRKELNDELDQCWKGKSRLEAENNQQQKNLTAYHQDAKKIDEKFNDQKLLHASKMKIAVEQYDNFISGASKDGNIMLYSTKERTERRQKELSGLIIGGQKEYNRRKEEGERLPEGMTHEAVYRARETKIRIDGLEEVKRKMVDQTRKYESIFKNEFVLSLYRTALEAKENIRGINKELRKLQFSTQYQFSVNFLDDKSDYAKILNYAEYLEETGKIDDRITLFNSIVEDDEIEKLEEDIKVIINRIIDKNDLGVIKSFADYRNYMSYEIIINNDEVKNGKLSKQVGYNSGAGTQIPYTLILSAALSMLYNARFNSTRLIFIDEPFEKMSDHNIKLMLSFFKSQNFQVIFCAPPNKTDSIGYECDTIIPVIKLRNDNMQIGSVQFYDES